MRKMLRAVLVFAFALAIAVTSLFFYSCDLTRRADALVRVSSDFANRARKPLSITDVQQQFGTKLRQKEGCTTSYCSYEVVLSNYVLAALHFAPYRELRSGFWVRDGIVIFNTLDFMTTDNQHRNVVAHADIEFDNECYFFLDPWGNAAPVETNGLATLSADCASAEKTSVLGLNTACLTEFHGCNTIADLLPTVWTRTDDNRIMCRIPNKKGVVHYPPSWYWMKD